MIKIRKEHSKMENAVKIRIIYPLEYGPEREYLQEFLEFIGCIVLCEHFYSDFTATGHEDLSYMVFKLHEEIQQLILQNDEEGWTDIILNYSTEEPFFAQNSRQIYMYFYADNKVCDLTELPVQNKCGQ